MKPATYLLKFDEDERTNWREYAKKHFRNNLARMIRIAVNQMIERGHDNITTEFNDKNIINKVESTRTEIVDQLNRIEDILTNERARDSLPLLLHQATEKEEVEKLNKEVNRKFDF